jgi:hypothetical protein
VAGYVFCCRARLVRARDRASGGGGGRPAASCRACGPVVRCSLPKINGHPQQLYGVSCVSSRFCEAVGTMLGSTVAGPPVIERWNGKRWSVQHIRARNLKGGLDAVSCTSVHACAAVGEMFVGKASVPLAVRWDGSRWSKQSVPDPNFSYPGSQVNVLHSVSCTSPRTCLAVGQYGYHASWGTVVFGALVERFANKHWSIAPEPAKAALLLTAIACGSATGCSALGYTETTAPDPVVTNVIERWNGSVWTQQAAPLSLGTAVVLGGNYGGIACTSGSWCEAVGGRNGRQPDLQPAAALWTGMGWALQATSVPTPVTAAGGAFDDVACPTRHACVAIGSAFTGPSAETLVGRWDGASWSVSLLDGPSDLAKISCSSRTWCMAVGYRASERYS